MTVKRCTSAVNMLLPNLPPPQEGIHHQSSQVEAYISQRLLGSGTLYIAESRLSWTKENSTEGISLEYPHIAVHAISRDPNNFHHPCLYIMLDVNLDGGTSNGQDDSDEDGEGNNEENMGMTEIRFVPSDPFLLENMYKSLSECQILHPDPSQDSDDDHVGEEDDDEEGEYDTHEGQNRESDEDNMEETEEGTGTCNGHHADNEDDTMETGQFEDAK